MEPEASVNRERVSEVSQREDKNNAISFHCSINNKQAPHKTRCELDVVMGFFNVFGKGNHAL